MSHFIYQSPKLQLYCHFLCGHSGKTKKDLICAFSHIKQSFACSRATIQMLENGANIFKVYDKDTRTK